MPRAADLPAQCDVAIVGGGFTGLSAALALAKRGASVVVLEAGERVAAEASGRNGGHVNNGLAVDYAEVAAKVGVERARAWYHAYDAAVDAVERIVRDEAIDCDFARRGKLKLATRPAHLEALSRSADRLVADGVDTDVQILHAPRVRPRWPASVSSAACSTSAAARCTWAASRTAWRRRPSAAARRSTPAPACSGSSGSGPRARRTACTPAAARVRAAQVLLANGAARHGGYGSFGWLRRRIVPIGSFIVVTEPLGAERAQALLRERRTYVTVANIHHYFRLTPDHRLVFGGRARFAVSQPDVGREERRDPARRHGRDVSVAVGRRASTTAGAAWST